MTSAKQKEAVVEKEKGNSFYKKKEFEKALEHYKAALKLDPTNIAIMTNRAAVYFEQNKLDDCIKECEKAIEVGRENHSPFNVIAKAFCRIGNAYLKKDDLEKALIYFNKSLSEHRVPEVVKKAQNVESMIKERERLAYIDPEISLQEKSKGNKMYQDGNFPEAIKHYNEAILRNPDDAKIYSNRSACYMKLMEYSLALKDAEECIKRDPTFVKGYLRKGATLLAQKETTKAADAYSKALELDPQCQEAKEGYQKSVMNQGNDIDSVKKRVMNNPEVQNILCDPAMRAILQQMQENPKAISEHLSNPEIRDKIDKLMECGIIDIR